MSWKAKFFVFGHFYIFIRNSDQLETKHSDYLVSEETSVME